MLSGVSLALSALPLELVAAHKFEERGGEREVEFLFRDSPRLLPVWLDGRLQLLTWGNRRGESRTLPCTAWTRLETVESGGWAAFQTKPVVVPASLGLDNNVWYRIREGVRGLVVQDDLGVPRVYIICEPATHYYQVMTRSRWMPALIGELI